jgi:hypothetical protein
MRALTVLSFGPYATASVGLVRGGDTRRSHRSGAA